MNMQNFRERPTQRFRESLKHSTSAGGRIMSHSSFNDHGFNSVLPLLLTPKSQVTWPGLKMTVSYLSQ